VHPRFFAQGEEGLLELVATSLDPTEFLKTIEDTGLKKRTESRNFGNI
jgi:hypothetical protein